MSLTEVAPVTIRIHAGGSTTSDEFANPDQIEVLRTVQEGGAVIASARRLSMCQWWYEVGRGA